jgi:hypothetical protein
MNTTTTTDGQPTVTWVLETKFKDLTDKEIAQVWVEHTKIAGTYDVKDIIFPFARAILRKAQEK